MPNKVAKLKHFRALLTGPLGKKLTRQQRSTLWGQARNGDLAGAAKGYRRIIDKRVRGDNNVGVHDVHTAM